MIDFFNFSFISTLVTAVLTHHLGWVATALPASQADQEFMCGLHKPYNALWGQLTDLYGAVGHPTKMAHTIVTGTNKGELISKILNSLTYFIRCSDIERKCEVRCDVKNENNTANTICSENSCIPKEYYKKYEDHLREMSAISSFNKCNLKYKPVEYKKNGLLENIEMNCFNSSDKNKPLADSVLLTNGIYSSDKKFGLSKTHTCMTNLDKWTKDNMCTKENLYPSLETLFKKELEDVKQNYNKNNSINEGGTKLENISLNPDEPKEFEFTNSEINEKVNKLLRVPASAIEYHMETDQQHIHKISEIPYLNPSPKKLNVEKQMSCNISVPQDQFAADTTKNIEKDVIFVLGDDEKLVGLKKGRSCVEFKNYEKENVTTDQTVGVDKCKSRGLKKEKSCFDFKNYIDEVETDEKSLESHSSEIAENKDNTTDSAFNIKKCSMTDASSTPRIARPTFLNLNDEESLSNFSSTCAVDENKICIESNVDKSFENSEFKESHFSKTKWKMELKPSTSWTSLNTKANNVEAECSGTSKELPKGTATEFIRSQSVPPEESKPKNNNIDLKAKYRYSGVKFNFQQYPQIVTNYMKSKNIELSNLPFVEKKMEYNHLSLLEGGSSFDFSTCDGDGEEIEALQTPSNASELECISEMVTEKYKDHHAKESVEKTCKTFVRTKLPNTTIREPILESNNLDAALKTEHVTTTEEKEKIDQYHYEQKCKEASQSLQKMKIVYLPMAKYVHNIIHT